MTVKNTVKYKKTETKRMGEDMKLIGIIKILEGRKWPRNN